MNKLVAAYLAAFVIMTFLSSIMEGGGGFATTQLNGDIDEDAVTITVDSTQGFLVADYIVIEDEYIAYTGTTAVSFTGCTRGYRNTEAAVHVDDQNVYSPDSGTLNTALGFNISSTGATAGTFAVITLTWNFLARAIPNLVMWDYSFFYGQLIYIRYLLMAIGVGFVVYFGFQAINAAMGILRR
jgi:hypothetical protein